MTDKEQLGKQIESLRQECGVSTYALEKKGIHPALPSTIEKGEKGYTIDSLLNYLNAIDEDIFLSVGKKVSNRRELLCAFFKYFRDNGEANIGMTIEEFVDGFLSTSRL